MFPHKRFGRVSEWSEVLLVHLRRHLTLPASVEKLLARSVLRQLDSAMLIEDLYTPFAIRTAAGNEYAIPEVDCLPAIDALVGAVESDGFGLHFTRLIGLFGHIMLRLAGTRQQIADASSWVENGLSGAFLMTDQGGASIKNWVSVLQVNGTAWKVTLDKLWGISAASCGFAIVIVKRSGGMTPDALLIPPAAYAQLSRHPVGLPYLDGAIQLGNCKGQISGSADWGLRRGGLVAVKQFLTICRPRFVLALMAHLHWLRSQGRLTLTPEQEAAIAYLTTLASMLSERLVLTRFSEDEVMALKFASNAILFDLVESGSVSSILDERDLLGFTKMEGSSYRCFYEIYTRNKGLRDG